MIVKFPSKLCYHTICVCQKIEKVCIAIAEGN